VSAPIAKEPKGKQNGPRYIIKTYIKYKIYFLFVR